MCRLWVMLSVNAVVVTLTTYIVVSPYFQLPIGAKPWSRDIEILARKVMLWQEDMGSTMVP